MASIAKGGTPDFRGILRLIAVDKGLADRLSGWAINPGVSPADEALLTDLVDYLRQCDREQTPAEILRGLVDEASLPLEMAVAFRVASGLTGGKSLISHRIADEAKHSKVDPRTIRRARDAAIERLALFLAKRPAGPLLAPRAAPQTADSHEDRSSGRYFTMQLDISVELGLRHHRPTAICETRTLTALDRPLTKWTSSSTSGAWRPEMLKHYGDGRFSAKEETSGLAFQVDFDPPLLPGESASFVIVRINDQPSEADGGKWGLTGRGTVRHLCVRLIGKEVPSRAWWYYEQNAARVPGTFSPERSILSAQERRRKTFDQILIGDSAGIAWKW